MRQTGGKGGVRPRERAWHRDPGALAPGYRRWLTDRGSLTDRVRGRCAAFRIELVFQEPRRAARDEGFFAGRRGRLALVREVFLSCGTKRVVFAHSVTPLANLRGAWRGLAGLGTRPLGAALFADPRVRRHPLAFRRLGPNHELHARACAATGRRLPALWARRSLFMLGKSPILVTEIFLPGILDL
jgi:chorismate--pyruvate lyase